MTEREAARGGRAAGGGRVTYCKSNKQYGQYISALSGVGRARDPLLIAEPPAPPHRYALGSSAAIRSRPPDTSRRRPHRSRAPPPPGAARRGRQNRRSTSDTHADTPSSSARVVPHALTANALHFLEYIAYITNPLVQLSAPSDDIRCTFVLALWTTTKTLQRQRELHYLFPKFAF
ncbi:hypothetical protein EVAR_30847_1 [Eumeta japonica]|uniref:Uncharacterized protein n=1 Tax=Eumeta variegata TaxID=151549 RepID=A0A4C1XUB9_EUMVA|nr:hypothetical protein EVAR_30847_1 [Eumeta japonica]